MTGIQLTDFDIEVDVKRDSLGRITSGLKLGDTTRQNQAIILLANPGEIKERPAIGCGIQSMLLEYDPAAWRTTIREQLELDGQIVDSVNVSKTGIQIDAHYRI